jgi:hypothetical protein
VGHEYLLPPPRLSARYPLGEGPSPGNPSHLSVRPVRLNGVFDAACRNGDRSAGSGSLTESKFDGHFAFLVLSIFVKLYF